MSISLLEKRWLWFKFSIKISSPTSNLKITSALPLTQYAENTYLLIFQSNKSVSSVPGFCFLSPFYTLLQGIHHVPFVSAHHIDLLFWNLYISQTYTPGMTNYLILSRTRAPFFFLSRSSLVFWRKWFYINLSLLVIFYLRRAQCQLHYISILEWFPTSGSDNENG